MNPSKKRLIRALLYSVSFVHLAIGSPGLAQDCLIIANGPPLKQSIVEALAKGKRIVALDGAVNTLKEIYRNPKDPSLDPIVPDVILGDFDSSQEAARKHFLGAEILHIEDQDTTDLEKGITHCLKLGTPEIWIVNALGLNRMDHTLANINILKKYSGRAVLRLISENETIEFVRNRTLHFTGERKQAVGVFGFPKARVTSTGLQYPMVKTEVELGGFFSSSNYISADEVTLVIEEEAVVTYPHRFQ